MHLPLLPLHPPSLPLLLPLQLPPLPPLSPYSLRLPSSSSFSFLFFIMCIHPLLVSFPPLFLNFPFCSPSSFSPSSSTSSSFPFPPYLSLLFTFFLLILLFFPSSFDLELPLVHPLSPSSSCAS